MDRESQSNMWIRREAVTFSSLLNPKDKRKWPLTDWLKNENGLRHVNSKKYKNDVRLKDADDLEYENKKNNSDKIGYL